MVEAARVAAQSHPYWKRQYEGLAKRIGEHKAVVAIARNLLIVVWQVLMAKSADREAEAEQVAVGLMVWGWKLSAAQRGGMTTGQFTRAQLMRIGLGEELKQVTRGGARRRIADKEEVLALQASQRERAEKEQSAGSPKD
jgi:hypothetical protein